MGNKNIMNKEGILFLDNPKYPMTAIGTIGDKKGYQRVRLNLNFLHSAINILQKQPKSEIDKGILLYVKTNYPIQIGKENLGVIIAPMINPDDEKYNQNLVNGNYNFPYLKVGNYVYVKILDMKKPIKVKLIDSGDNGDLKDCLFFKYKGTKYYLSVCNFVRTVEVK